MSKRKRNYRAHMHVHTYTHTHTHEHKVFIETYTHKSRPIWKEILSKVSGENKRSKMESVGCVCGRLIIQEQWLQTLTPPPPSDLLTGHHWASAESSFCCWPLARLIKSFKFVIPHTCMQASPHKHTHFTVTIICTVPSKPPPTMMPQACGFAICPPCRQWKICRKSGRRINKTANSTGKAESSVDDTVRH